MKIVKILSTLAAACALVIGCAKETPSVWNEIQVSSSYVGLPGDGGSKTITVNAKDSWSITDIPSWLTITPSSGAVGETPVTFTAEKASSTQEGSVSIVCAGKTQTVKIIQVTEKVDPVEISVRQALEVIAQYPDGSPLCRVKGTVCKIQEISAQYGNATFYISDDGTFGTDNWLEVYRGLWLDGAAFKTGDEFELGDELIIEGNLMSYKGTPETVEKSAYVVKINKSLIKCDSLVVDGVKGNELPLEGGVVDAVLTCKGDGISVNIPDEAKSWLSIIGIKTEGTSAVVSFLAAKNEEGDRSVDLSFTTTSAGKTYSAAASIFQKGAIVECSIDQFNKAAIGPTVYRLSGIVTVVDDASKGNFHFKDFSGETYVYKAKNIADYSTIKVGDIVTITGTRDAYGTTIELTNGEIENLKPVSTVTAAEANALPDEPDTKNPQNYILLKGVVSQPTAPGRKWDISTYGNFDLVDETGDVYIYGVSTGWKGETKKFSSLGVEEGDIITLVGYKTSYTDKDGNYNNEIVCMYVSHEKGDVPEEGSIKLTAAPFPTTYADNAQFTVAGRKFIANQVANYGNGIQFKTGVGYVINEAAFEKKIKKVTCVAFSGKTWYKDNISILAGNSADALEPVAATDEKNLVYDLSGKDCTFLKVANTSGYAFYLESITIEFE